MIWVLKYWKALALLSALTIAAGGVWYVQKAAYNRGYDKAMAEYEAAKISAAKAAQKKTEADKPKYNAVRKEVSDAPDDCYERATIAIDGMPNP